MLYKAVQAFVHYSCTLFLYICCLGVLHVISLYALSLHNSAHSLGSLVFAC